METQDRASSRGNLLSPHGISAWPHDLLVGPLLAHGTGIPCLVHRLGGLGRTGQSRRLGAGHRALFREHARPSHALHKPFAVVDYCHVGCNRHHRSHLPLHGLFLSSGFNGLGCAAPCTIPALDVVPETSLVAVGARQRPFAHDPSALDAFSICHHPGRRRSGSAADENAQMGSKRA